MNTTIQTENLIGPDKVMDVRPIPCSVKHGLIIQTWLELPVGDHFILLNDHDPVPLYYQFSAQWPGAFTLLLTGMLHIETLLKERLRLERTEQRLRAELESQVKEKTAHLTKAIEELRLEIDERKRMEAQVEKTHKELLIASRQAGMAEIATKVLRKMVDMLKSVEVSASLVSDQVKQSKIANVVRIGTLLRENQSNLGAFMARDPRGQKLPVYIGQLAEHLASEQTVLSNELESLRSNIKEIVAMQESYAELSGAADTSLVEDVPPMNASTPHDIQVSNECEKPHISKSLKNGRSTWQKHNRRRSGCR